MTDIPKIGCVNHDCDKCQQSQKQEPVAFIDNRIHGFPDCFVNYSEPPHTSPVYTSPPQRPVAEPHKPLTNLEIADMFAKIKRAENPYLQFARAIEAAHGITGEQK